MWASFLWFSQVAVLLTLNTAELQISHQHVDANDAMQVFYEKTHETLREHARGLAITAPNVSFPSKTGMSDTCSNKLCDMFEKALTCKSFGLDFDKVCAKHILGAILNCPKYPGPDDIYNAPSICGTEFAGLLGLVGGGDILTLFSNYLFVDFETNACHRRCFQDYQYKSNDFYYSCYGEITNVGIAANYSLAAQLQNFQFFRNQACDTNDANVNCYETAAALLVPQVQSTAGPSMIDTITQNLVDKMTEPESALAAAAVFEEERLKAEELKSTGADTKVRKLSVEEETSRENEMLDTAHMSRRLQSDLDLLDPTCNYFNLSSTWSPITSQSIMDFNNMVLSGVCGQFSLYGCCAANIVSLVAQDQTDATDIKFFPPCLLRYINVACPTSSLTNFCNNGSTANLTTLVGSVTLAKFDGTALGFQPFPNMYDQSAILTFQGLISFGFTGVPGLNSLNEPYILNPFKPLQVQITNYVYYNASGYPLTPANGSLYYPPKGDYEEAASGTFTFQIVLQNLNGTAQMDAIYNAIISPYFYGTLTAFYGTTVSSAQVSGPFMYVAEPLDLPAKSAASTSSTIGSSLVFLVISAAVAYLL